MLSHTLQACDFLQRWPTLEALQKTRPAALREFYLKHHNRRPELIQLRLEEIRRAQPLTQDSAVIAASSLMVRALVAQLRALCSLRRAGERPAAPAGLKRKSNMQIVYDILVASKGSLHITDILQRAKTQYHRPLRRESLVSALTKKVLDQNTFTRTAPNTFELLQRPS